MIDVEQFARIRRLFYAEHWTIGTIATELGVHRDTVGLAIQRDQFARAPRQVRATQLDPYKELARQTLEQHPRLRATRLFEMIRERGYPGSVVQLRRYLQSIRPSARAE